MAQSLSKILLHVVFSTKGHVPSIQDEWREELYAYLATTCRTHGSQAYRVGGTRDHVHIACTLPRTLTVADLLQHVKASSSSWVRSSN